MQQWLTMGNESDESVRQDRPRALLLESDGPFVHRLAMALRYDGWSVETAAEASEAVENATETAPAVIVASLELLGDGAGDFLTELRRRGILVPVLFLTEASQDHVNRLSMSGSFELQRPFSLEELMGTMRMLDRRAHEMYGETVDPRLVLGDLVLDEDTFEVHRGGEPIDLTPTEFSLLRYLVRNHGRVLTKSQILDRVWETDFEGKPTVVELYISYLRKAVDTDRPPMVLTVRSAGYMVKEPPQRP